MPDIPAHLRHLATWRGLPVPFINRVGRTERPEDWTIRFDRTLKEVAAFLADEPDGPPDFTKQCIQRQREVTLAGLCQVCARPVDWPDRALVVSSLSVERVDVDGRHVAVVIEPWLCPDCADFAVNVCPALIRRNRDDDLHVIQVTSPQHCQLVLSRGWIDGPYEQATRANPVAMWVKILLLDVNVKAPAHA